jgi:hypothetical protein
MSGLGFIVAGGGEPWSSAFVIIVMVALMCSLGRDGVFDVASEGH